MDQTTAASQITPELVEELKLKNPGRELSVLDNDEFEIAWVCKTPLPGDYQAFRAQQSAAGDDLVPIIRAFVLNHVVWPTIPEVREQLARHAGLIEPASKQLMKLVGARAEFAVKKL